MEMEGQTKVSIPNCLTVENLTSDFEQIGFKTEWATVKDDLLYVGSTGKEWTAGEVST